MRGGHIDAISRTHVAGWAADSDRPNERSELSVSVNGRVLARIVANRPRTDLAALGKFGDGAHGFAYRFPEPLAPEQDHVVALRFAEDGKLIPTGERHVAREAPPRPGGLCPILVTAPGRSGTSYLMSALAQSPEIVVAELVPYEVRMLSYYAAAFAVLTAPADLESSTHPDRLEGDGFHIGFNPFNSPQYGQAFRDQARLRTYVEDYAPRRLGEGLRELVDGYYQALAQDKGKGSAKLFAEKNNNLNRPTRRFVRRVFAGVREIVIVRDPRDVLCSHMAYFSSSAEKAFAQLTHAGAELLAIRREAKEDLHIIRYEDMIAGEAATYAGLSAFLGTRIEPVEAGSGKAMFERHGTSASPESSIGRWRVNLPAQQREKSSRAWAEFLTAFGYGVE